MKMKSYYAATVEAALKMATQEMGPDALLVNSRRTGADTRHLGEYEVVFAILPEQGRQRRRAGRTRGAVASPRSRDHARTQSG